MGRYGGRQLSICLNRVLVLRLQLYILDDIIIGLIEKYSFSLQNLPSCNIKEAIGFIRVLMVSSRAFPSILSDNEITSSLNLSRFSILIDEIDHRIIS